MLCNIFQTQSTRYNLDQRHSSLEVMPALANID